MHEKTAKRTAFGKEAFLYPLLISILFGLVGLFIVYHVSLTEAEYTLQRTLQRVKERSLYSLRFEEVDKVNNLVRLLDKTKELAHHAADPGDRMSSIERLQHDMRIDGVIVIDENLKPAIVSGVDYADWEDTIRSSRVPDVIRFPKKTSLDRVTIGDQLYDFVAIARRDVPGVVIAISKNNMTDRKSGLFTLDILFTDDTFLLDSSVFITDGKTILDTNEKKWLGKPVAQAEFLDFTRNIPVRSVLYQTQRDGSIWYGEQSRVRDLIVSVFSPKRIVLQNCWYFGLFMLFVYAVLQVVFLYIRQHSMSAQMQAISDKLKTIQAASTLFTDVVLANVQDRSFEPIKISKPFGPFIAESSTSNDIIQLMATRAIKEKYRDGYLAFHNFATVEKRLKASPAGYIEYLYETKSGRWVRDFTVAQAYSPSGKLIKVLTLANDVSDIMQREQEYQAKLIETARAAEASAVAKMNFLRHMSHDIRTPINGIIGMLEISGRHPEDAELQAHCQKNIRNASLILLELINDVLDLSKLDADELHGETKVFSLKELWEESRPTLEVMCERKHVKLEVSESCTHSVVKGRPTLLRRILMNIITNAIKYNRENGTVFVHLRETDVKADHAVYEFVCRDNGIGMSEEFQKKAFEPFSQENDNVRTTYEGTGLGLTIARRIIDQMGGTIDFTSQQGVGTTFTIRIPLLFAENDSTRIENAPQVTDSSLVGRHVLLVEDNELNREIARFSLQDSGAEVTCAENGKVAVDTFLSQPAGTFDLILMDLMMPHMNGYEATRVIRSSTHAQAKTIPIVAMSANAFTEDVTETKKVGMNAHVAKPFSAQKLVETLANVMTKC